MLPNPPLLTLRDILLTPLPPVEWDCEPIIPHHRRVVMFGEFGALKSWILLHLGLHLAKGASWLGTFPVTTPRNVLYIDEEMAEEDLRRRVKLLCSGMQASPDEFPADFRAFSRVGVTFDALGAYRLMAHLKRHAYEPSVVIVESLVRVLVGSENLSWDVAAFWRNVEPILRGGSTIIVSHHMGKVSPDAPEPKLRGRARGSTEILAGCDVGWGVEIVEEGSVSRLTCVKTRASRTPQGFRVTVTGTEDQVLLAVVDRGQPRQHHEDQANVPQVEDHRGIRSLLDSPLR